MIDVPSDLYTSYRWDTNMKLYWRLKIKGKWTWRPARHEPLDPHEDLGYVVVEPLEEE